MHKIIVVYTRVAAAEDRISKTGIYYYCRYSRGIPVEKARKAQKIPFLFGIVKSNVYSMALKLSIRHHHSIYYLFSI